MPGFSDRAGPLTLAALARQRCLPSAFATASAPGTIITRLNSPPALPRPTLRHYLAGRRRMAEAAGTLALRRISISSPLHAGLSRRFPGTHHDQEPGLDHDLTWARQTDQPESDHRAPAGHSVGRSCHAVGLSVLGRSAWAEIRHRAALDDLALTTTLSWWMRAGAVLAAHRLGIGFGWRGGPPGGPAIC